MIGGAAVHVAVQLMLRPAVFPVLAIATVIECAPEFAAVYVSDRLAPGFPKAAILKEVAEKVPEPVGFVSVISASWLPLLTSAMLTCLPLAKLVMLIVSVLSPTPLVPITVPVVLAPVVLQLSDWANVGATVANKMKRPNRAAWADR